MTCVLGAIPNGKENRITVRQIAQITGLHDPDKSKRYHRKLIEKLRREGCPIVSDAKGFWYTEDAEELKEYYEAMLRRAKSTIWTAKTARDMYRKKRRVRQKLLYSKEGT